MKNIIGTLILGATLAATGCQADEELVGSDESALDAALCDGSLPVTEWTIGTTLPTPISADATVYVTAPDADGQFLALFVGFQEDPLMYSVAPPVKIDFDQLTWKLPSKFRPTCPKD